MNRSADLYFLQLEAQFRHENISDDLIKYDRALAQLQPQLLESASHIIRNPPAENKYESLKGTVLNEHKKSDYSRVMKLVQNLTECREKPSQMMRKMRNLAGDLFSEQVLKMLWLSRLPPPVRMIIAADEDKSLLDCAIMADKLITVLNPIEALEQPQNTSTEIGACQMPKDTNPVVDFELNLPEGWIKVIHATGVPVYLHKYTRVVSTSPPYEIGPKNVQTHQIPHYANGFGNLSSIPRTTPATNLVATPKAVKAEANLKSDIKYSLENGLENKKPLLPAPEQSSITVKPVPKEQPTPNPTNWFPMANPSQNLLPAIDMKAFNEMKIEDPKLVEYCKVLLQPTPLAILMECVKQKFHNIPIAFNNQNIAPGKNLFTVIVGPYKTEVVCKSKQEGKELGAQHLLQLFHPRLQNWGAVTSLYPTSNAIQPK